MALSHNMTLPNGVAVSYHRIVGVTTIVNCSTIIEVASYVSAEKRREEESAISKSLPMDIFVHTSYRQPLYRESLSVPDAYAYLKGLPEYAGANDC